MSGSKNKKENIHAAASEEDCEKMGKNYGGLAEDWYKMTSNQAFMINGASVQIHWFRNIQTLQDVELKFKRQYPKTAPKNQ